MKRTFTLLLAYFLVLGSLWSATDPPTVVEPITPPTERLTAGIPLLLYPGMDLNVDGSRLRILSLDDAWTGSGTLFFPAIGEELSVEFSGLEVNAFGQLLGGILRARTQVRSSDEEAGLTAGRTLPLNITPHLRSRQNFLLPDGALMNLKDVVVTDKGTFVSLDFDTPTLVEDDMLSFNGTLLKVDALTFCLEDADLAIASGGGEIDDYEFPMRILAGDPTEDDEGSYVTFNCDGFQEFNLAAQYAFPVEQVTATERGQDTVFANFRINATGLTNFIAFATVTPFDIVGLDGMSFTIDSAYVDYSDQDNPEAYRLDPVTEEAPEADWKGLFIQKLEVTLPEQVNAFSPDAELTIGGSDIVYSRGNGMSGNLFAYNLLKLTDGSLDGWGVSIDTIKTDLIQNSVKEFNMAGKLYIPVFDRGDNIDYSALLGKDETGKTTFVFGLEVAGEYTMPLFKNMRMELEENSLAGVQYTSDGGFEPYLNVSGSMDIELKGNVMGVEIPEVILPGIKFQNFRLNDTMITAANNAVGDAATAGVDRMSFGAFNWTGIDLGTLGDAIDQAEREGNEKEKEVNGKAISIEDFAFETVIEDGKELKQLSLKAKVNFTKGRGGIGGDLNLGIRGQIEYPELVSLTPWKALSFHSLDISSIYIDVRYKNCRFEGAVSIYQADEVYGKGWKGGIGIEVGMASKTIKAAAMAQFGTAPGDYNYFFVDLRTEIIPGIPIGPVEVIGFGGGVYFNMTKSIVPQGEFGGSNPTVSAEPGQSFSGARYTPRNNSLGLALSTVVQMKSSPEVFSGDMELTFEFGPETGSGIRKILFSGQGYFIAKDRKKRKEAAIRANLALEMNFERGFLNGSFVYEVGAPYNNPILVGGDLGGAPQGALSLDINPDDETDYKNFFYFGTPRRMADIGLKIGGEKLLAEGYFMIGEELMAPLPLRTIHPAFAGFPDLSRSSGGGVGLAFGVKFSTEGEASAGPIKLDWDVVLGADASIRKYTGVTCANTGEEIGMGGWYIKGRAYAYIEAGVELHVKIDLGVTSIDKKVQLARLAVTASLVAELPNPSYVGGKVRVKGSALGFSVTKSVTVKIGEKCQMQDNFDAASIVAKLKVIEAVYPEKDSEDTEAFPIFADPVIAFKFPVGDNPNRPYNDDGRIELADNDDNRLDLFPYIRRITLRGGSQGPVRLTRQWNDEHSVLSLVSDKVLDAEADYTLNVEMLWRIKLNGAPWKDLRGNDGTLALETKSIPFKTGAFPTTIDLAMLEPDRHFPGYNQRNWHQNFGPGAIYFSKEGMDNIFASRVTKEVAGYGEKEIDCTYSIRLTHLENDESQLIPITERPGDVQLEELYEQDYEYDALADAQGGTVPVKYTKREVRSYNSKGIKFDGINEDGLLDKGAIYRFEILRIPVPEEEDQIVVEQQETLSSTGVGGIAITETNSTISGGGDPFQLPDVVYKFYFRVSKYENLQQKIEQMRFVTSGKGRKLRGIDHPAVAFVSAEDIAGAPAKNKMDAIADDYYLYRIDEGFDWWERQRLAVNLRLDESAAPDFYQGSAGQNLRTAAVSAAQIGKIPTVWKEAFDVNLPNREDGVWSGLTFPQAPSDLKDMYPQLTQDEIDNKKGRNVVLYPMRANDGNYTASGKWDLAVVHKGKRALAFQASCAAIMGLTFHANDPYYKASYIGTSWNSNPHEYVSTKYQVVGEQFAAINYVGPSANGYNNIQIRASNTNGNGPDGIVLAGFGALEEKIVVDVEGIFTWEGEWEFVKTISFSRFQHTWVRLQGYDLPDTNDLAGQLKRGRLVSQYFISSLRPYTAPLRFHFKPNYSSLTERVTGAETISKTVENLMKR